MSEQRKKEILWDDLQWDGTDGAHPAWWRGCDAGADSTVHVIHKILDDIENGVEPSGVFGSKKLDMLRDRLYQMYKRRIEEKVKANLGKKEA